MHRLFQAGIAGLTITILMIGGTTGCEDADVPTTGYFGRVGTSGCVPTVCQVSGDPLSERKAWHVAHPCEPMPDELACRVRTVLDGEDWPDKVEEAIETASAEDESLTDLQKEALRCLAFMPGVNQFAIGRIRDGSPRQISLNMPVVLQGGNRLAAQEYIDRFGPYLGQIWNLNRKLSLQTTVSGDIIITTSVNAYDGIELRYPQSMEIRLDRFQQAPTWEGCPNLYTNTVIDSQIVSGTIKTGEGGRLTPEQATRHVIESHPDCVELQESDPTLVIWNSRLYYMLTVGCKSHCGDPGWPFEAVIDAYTGVVVDFSEECCVDCWEEDAKAFPEQDAAQPEDDIPTA